MIEARKRTVYYSPSRGRHFFTLKAAVNAEAVAIIKRKYPTEHGDPEEGGGWHWTQLRKADVILRRMTIVVRNAFAAKQVAP